MAKALTLRLDDQRAAMLEMVARADGQTVSDALRAAIDAHIEERKRDRRFQEALAKVVRENQDILDLLAR